MYMLTDLFISYLLHILGAEYYGGTLIGAFNTSSHGVAGQVYIVDEKRFLIKQFSYDGAATGKYRESDKLVCGKYRDTDKRVCGKGQRYQQAGMW